MRPVAATAALILVAAAPCAAQVPPLPTPDWTWYLSAGVGLVGREVATWAPTHRALAPTGWDSRYQTNCVYLCQSASDPVLGRPATSAVAARRRLDDPWQLRVLGALASPGYYPGGYSGNVLVVRPKSATFSVQAVMTASGFWLAAGPSYYLGQVTTTAGPSTSTTRKNGVGLVLTGGASFPRVTNWFIDAIVERRFAGSVNTPALPVPGAPDVPALTVGLSATVLSVGVGWRL